MAEKKGNLLLILYASNTEKNYRQTDRQIDLTYDLNIHNWLARKIKKYKFLKSKKFKRDFVLVPNVIM